ncbi:sterol carrier protein 2-like [Zingiber officinale]|uniref:sterol carrier protein 2-like n=1 Tax=Zingiber officinale TaxID=94328 RepID=UPI001C4B0879|nr:sterol carrier protein 2-like [Zingiber officinale]
MVLVHGCNAWVLTARFTSSIPLSTSLKSAALLEQMKVHLATDTGKQISSKISLVYQLNIAPKKIGVDEGIYVVDLKQGTVTEGPFFPFTDNDFLSIATRKMNLQIAFVRGAMKIKGSISAAQKFTPDIFPKPSKL